MLGRQVRGATAHFDAVVSGATSGVLNAAMASGVPVIFCVMTTDTMEQARCWESSLLRQLILASWQSTLHGLVYASAGKA